MFALWGTSLVGGRLGPMTMPIVLPWPLQSSLEAAARALLQPSDRSHIDFSRPTGEPALVSPDSVSWRVFKNPLSLFIGGVAAVIMELAEPRVRVGTCRAHGCQRRGSTSWPGNATGAETIARVPGLLSSNSNVPASCPTS